MKSITAELREKNLKLNQLSQDLLEQINQHKEMIVKYNMAVEAYENSDDEDSEIESKLDEQEDFLAKHELLIVNDIRLYASKLAESSVTQTETQTETEKITETPKAKKTDNSAGWLIFGGAVLLVTLGAVNVFKKK